MTRTMLPLIDLHALDGDAHARASLTAEVRRAGRDAGVLYASGHDVSPALVAEHFAFARAFFALDESEKREIAVERTGAFRGYETLGSQTIDVAVPGDRKEGFIMGPHLDDDHPHVRAGYPNTGANRWPRRPAGFREHMEAWVAAMIAVARRMARALALALDVSEALFVDLLAEPLAYSQMFRYPSVPSSAGAGLGAGVHTDWGLLTVLLQDDVGGLDMRTTDGAWIPVPPVPETLVIIFGELLYRMTDGIYTPAMHRVRVNTSGRERYSMPTFVDPPYDARIACVPTCLPAHGAARFPACTVAEHMLEMARSPLSLR